MTFEFNGKLYGLNMDGLLFAILILSAFLMLALVVSLMRIYKKAGKPAISAIIPIWNIISWLQIIDKPIWYIILFFVPFVNIYVMFVMYIGLAKKFGKGAGFGILSVFFPWIMIPLLSFYEYKGEEKKEEESIYNPFNETNVNQVMPSAPMDNAAPAVVAPTIDGSANPVQETKMEETESNNVANSTQEVENQASIPTVESTQESSLEGQENTNPIVEESVSPNMTIDNQPILGEATPVEEEPVVIKETENTPVIPEVNNESGVLEEQPVSEVSNVEPVIDDNSQNIQEIGKELYTNKPVEAKDIAFGKAPVVEEPVKEEQPVNTPNETLETMEPTLENQVQEPTQNGETVVNNTEVSQSNVNGTSTDSRENTQTSDEIELPEKASKTCPACGVSLAEDTKFCVACGTQL